MNSIPDNSDATPVVQNLYAHSDSFDEGEVIEPLLEGGRFRLERIVSDAHSTPEGEWYDQDEDEWVMLVSGKAQLRFEASGDVLELSPGDYIRIPAHCRHRVESTDTHGTTTWLALHYG